MVTEELKSEKLCAFCVSDYHLEMILLPYIIERINDSKFIILTEKNLEESLNTLLEKLNFNNKIKEKIKNINWKNENKEIPKDLNKSINIIVNGSVNFIKSTNNSIKNLNGDNIKVINCYHIGDTDVDIEELSSHYKYILNTQKINF